LVYGPARAGKSRTALEAATTALPNTVIIAPAGSEGLKDLLDLEPPMKPRAARAVLWLDSLERYHDGIDPTMFDTLGDLDVPVTIVATVRTGDYERLLTSSGERGDAARAVAARARAFEVPAALVLVAFVALVVGFTKPVPPTLGEQADAIKRHATASGRILAQEQKVDFHGDTSYLFAFQNKNFQKLAFTHPGPPSDQLEIYDAVGGKLVRRFSFQPSEGGAAYQYRFSGDLN